MSFLLFALIPLIQGCAVPLLVAAGSTAGGFALLANDSPDADEKRLVNMTSKQYGIDATQVSISNIKQESRGLMAKVGGAPIEVTYDAVVNGRQLRCIALLVGQLSGGGGDVNCSTPGTPIKRTM